MIKFSDFISHHGLIDMQTSGAKYTWSNNQASPWMSRLDRFLISPSWEEHFPNVFLEALPNPVSNHILLLLDHVERSLGPAPFRFETMWFEVKGFKDLVRRVLQNLF